MTKYQAEKVGRLDAIEIPGRADRPVVVMLHGYGADAGDLAPLSQVLKFPEGTGWIVPHGPIEVPLGPFYSGRAWGPISITQLPVKDLSQESPKELFESQKMILEILSLRKIELSRVIFAGFSQGAMLATQLALTSLQKPLGLILFSGTVINAAQWEREGVQAKGLKFFQSHGRFDDVLPLSGAEKLESLLLKCGLVGKLVKFDGGHEIPLEVLNQAQEYIYELIPRSEWEERHGH